MCRKLDTFPTVQAILQPDFETQLTDTHIHTHRLNFFLPKLLTNVF